MSEHTKQHRENMVHLRMAHEIREKVEALCAISGRTRTAEMLRLIERGFDMDAMIAGPQSGLLLDLFVAARGDGAKAARIMDQLDKHFSWGELESAILNVQLKHPAVKS